MAKINVTLNDGEINGKSDGTVDDITTLIAYILSDMSGKVGAESAALMALIASKVAVLSYKGDTEDEKAD
jgi:hypothetical protein